MGQYGLLLALGVWFAAGFMKIGAEWAVEVIIRHDQLLPM